MITRWINNWRSRRKAEDVLIELLKAGQWKRKDAVKFDSSATYVSGDYKVKCESVFGPPYRIFCHDIDLELPRVAKAIYRHIQTQISESRDTILNEMLKGEAHDQMD